MVNISRHNLNDVDSLGYTLTEEIFAMVSGEPQDDLEHAVGALLDKFSEEDIKDMLKHVKRQSMNVPKLILR